MLVYGLQQQCEKHFRRIHPSLNVVVTPKSLSSSFPPQFLGIAPLQNLAKNKNEHSSSIFPPSSSSSRRDQQQGREGTCAALTQSHPIFQRPVVGARPEARRENCIVCSVVVPLHIISSLRCSVFRSPTFLYHRRRGGQQHRITFTQRDFVS